MICWLFHTKPLLNQCWFCQVAPYVQTPMKFFHNTVISIPGNTLENTMWNMAAIVVRPSCINDFQLNIFSLRQNCYHFTDNSFKCIFLNENVWISLKMSLKFVPKFWINSIPPLGQIRLGTDQVTSHYLNQWWLVYWGTYVSLSLNEFRKTKYLLWNDWRN